MITEKYYEEWYGVKFPVRVLPVDEDEFGYSPIKVADTSLWAAIECDYNHEDAEKHSEAVDMDNEIYFYCDSGYIASDPSDEELIEYLRENTL